MNYLEAIDYIKENGKRGFVLGLENMERGVELLPRLDDRIKFIHIAGTNGKGSVSSYIARALQEAGYEVGLFTSPALRSFTERIRINGIEIPKEKVAQGIGLIKDFCQRKNIPITEFETVCLLALWYFYTEEVDFAVLEVGMGGRLDATNVIKKPLAFAITNIGMDHMAYLGNTIGEIAGEKAGIIKKESKGVSYPQEEAAKKVLVERAEEKGARLFFIDKSNIDIKKRSIEGTDFTYRGEAFRLKMLGDQQVKNACLAIEVLNMIKEEGYEIPHSAILQALKETALEGRIEIIERDPLTIIDASHNPQGLSALFSTLERLYPKKKWNLIFGCLKDKDYMEMLRIMKPHVKELIYVPPRNPRRLSSQEFYSACKSLDMTIKICYDNLDCMLKNEGEWIGLEDKIILGSFYHTIEIRDYIIKRKKDGKRFVE